jgi:aminomethyltransferase
MEKNLKRTALYEWHVAHGGRMVPFAGWEMPVQYPTGPTVEHHTTRKAAGLFDIDHMGQIEVRGPQAEAFLNYLVTYDVASMKLYDAHYAIFCYDDGTCVDDLFVYKLPDETTQGSRAYFFLAVNASNREKDVAWVKAHQSGFDVEVKDISDETFMLAFQGPKAVEIMNRLTRADLTAVSRFTSAQDVILEDVPVLFGRTGYTGEDGFELFFPAEHALKVWEAILAAGEPEGVKPIGLAARDSLRFEACMPLYGQEISAAISPVQARLGFALSLDKEFIGRDALLKQKLEGPSPVQVGIQMVDGGVPRHGYPIAVNSTTIGEVTSGMYAPTSESYVGLAYVPKEYAAIGTELDVIIREKPKKVRVVKRPFYIPAYRRNS